MSVARTSRAQRGDAPVAIVIGAERSRDDVGGAIERLARVGTATFGRVGLGEREESIARVGVRRGQRLECRELAPKLRACFVEAMLREEQLAATVGESRGIH